MARQRILIVYFSRTGNTKKVARELSSLLGCKAEPIRENSSRTGYIGYFRSGFEISFGIVPKIDDFPDVSGYDVVVLGTPVWSHSISSPMRAFLITHAREFSRVAFFCTEGGSGAELVFRKMSAAIKREPLATLEIDFGDLTFGAYRKKMAKFASELKKKAAR